LFFPSKKIIYEIDEENIMRGRKERMKERKKKISYER